MAYDHALADRVRACLKGEVGLFEAEMFGGLAFMINGNMSCGVTGNELIIRVGSERHEAILERENVKPFDMTGRPMKGWFVVEESGIGQDSQLAEWVSAALEFARSLPAK